MNDLPLPSMNFVGGIGGSFSSRTLPSSAVAMLVWPASRSRPMAVLRKGGHDLRAGAGPDLAAALVVVDIADPVQPVLDHPVPAQPGGDLLGDGVGDGEAGKVGDFDLAAVNGETHGDEGGGEGDCEHRQGSEDDVEEAVDGTDAELHVCSRIASVVLRVDRFW